MSEYIAADVAATDEMPETLEINGVTYRRMNDLADKVVAEIDALKSVADRTGLTLREVTWFTDRHVTGIPIGWMPT